MRSWIVVGCILISACGNNEATVDHTSRTTTSATTIDTQTISTDSNSGFAKKTETLKAPSVPVIKTPSGIYQFLLPYGENEILHTVAFYPESFRLQEEYLGKKDSIVLTEGTWTPSQGAIWLYKEQLVRGRYTWKGDTLQYLSPGTNKKFSLAKLTPASNNAVWMAKAKEGAILFGVGTEPFWSVEVKTRDSAILSMPDWPQPLRVRLSAINKTADSTVYSAANDSLRIAIYPYFCNDGMSDFSYTNKVTVQYKGYIYKGCGVVF
jgi:uncharacterized membrane protein